MKLNLLLVSLFSVTTIAVTPDKKDLPIGFAPHEQGVARPTDTPITDPPKGRARSIGEWETSDAALTLWNNPSFISALAKRGRLALLADSTAEKTWWENWLRTNHIPDSDISYFIVPTDSFWIRDYGPWYILDGDGKLGIIDTKYNRPRPKDDLVPQFLAQTLGLPLYQPGLVHTGGNYYSDGHGNAFSSTLVYRENSMLSAEEVRHRMLRYLGVDRYSTSQLAPGITIEHLDTFGKLVAPDTWVFSEFPVGSQFRDDSENMVKLLRSLASPYGTPYKIFRMKMTPKSGTTGEDYRAYINAFISNGVLYYPTYGGPADEEARRVYSQALPGYEIVGVNGQGTSWGDSIHCRSNNLHSRKSIFLFPSIARIPTVDSPGEVRMEIYPSPGAMIDTRPTLYWTVNGSGQAPIDMEFVENRIYRAELPPQSSGTKISLYVKAKDSQGFEKTAPLNAPQMTIDLTTP